MAGTQTTVTNSEDASWTLPLGGWFGRVVGPQTMPVFVSWILLGGIVFLSLIALYMSFVPFLPTEPGFTLEHWTNLARPYVIKRVIPNTLIVGIGTVLVSLIFAGPLSWLLNRTELPFRDFFTSLLAVVVLIPGFVQCSSVNPGSVGRKGTKLM